MIPHTPAATGLSRLFSRPVEIPGKNITPRDPAVLNHLLRPRPCLKTAWAQKSP